jgi:hypothetical protein
LTYLAFARGGWTAARSGPPARRSSRSLRSRPGSHRSGFDGHARPGRSTPISRRRWRGGEDEIHLVGFRFRTRGRIPADLVRRVTTDQTP